MKAYVSAVIFLSMSHLIMWSFFEFKRKTGFYPWMLLVGAVFTSYLSLAFAGLSK